MISEDNKKEFAKFLLNKTNKDEVMEKINESIKKMIEKQSENIQKCIENGKIKKEHIADYSHEYMAEFVDILANVKFKDKQDKVVLISENTELLKMKNIIEERHKEVAIISKEKGIKLLMLSLKDNMAKNLFEGNHELDSMFEEELEHELENLSSDKKDLSYIG